MRPHACRPQLKRDSLGRTALASPHHERPLSNSFDLPRIVLAGGSAVVLARRYAADLRGAWGSDAPPTVVMRHAAALLAVVGLTWTAAGLVTGASAEFEWPGLLLGGLSSAVYLVLAATAPRPSAEAARSYQLGQRRQLALMLATLGGCGGLAGMILRFYWLALPMLAVMVFGWAWLVVLFFRS